MVILDMWKKKALKYLHSAAPIAAASSIQELSSAAKIINNLKEQYFRTRIFCWLMLFSQTYMKYTIKNKISNIMDCEEYDLPEAVVFNNDNLKVKGKIVYAPVYMAMFLEKNDAAPVCYRVDLTGL